MSIMSNTVLVKINKNKYEVHVCGGGFLIPELMRRGAKERKSTVFADFNKCIRKWGKPEAIVDGAEAILIADAHSISKHKFAGDAVLLFDKSAKKIYYRKGNYKDHNDLVGNPTWEEL